jgi:chromate transporter
MMHDEVVTRRRWLSDQEFLDLVGVTNLIPGPNSTEMAIHIGFLRGGLPGLMLAGLSFILPAMAIVLSLAFVYVHYGSAPQAEWLFYGIKPVVIAIIVQALWNLGKKSVRTILHWVIALAIAGLYFTGINPVLLLIFGGLVTAAVEILQHNRWLSGYLFFPLAGGLLPSLQSIVPVSLSRLFLTFLKIGSVLYGSGYVLLAFLRADFVVRYGWLTDKQLIDAIAIGQVTPGPVFTTATFIGYILSGVPGGLLATLGIFLPSFIFVAISNPLIPKIRNSPWMGSVLDGVNVASLGLMAAVTWKLAQASFPDPLTILVAIVSFILIIRYKMNTTWLIAGGALIGVLKSVI